MLLRCLVRKEGENIIPSATMQVGWVERTLKVTLRLVKTVALLVGFIGFCYGLFYVTTRKINYVARGATIVSIAGFPMLVGLPCFFCVPVLRRPIVTVAFAWGLLYLFGMTLGIRTSATYLAWFFSELWLTFALKVVGVTVFYGALFLGLLLANVMNVMILTLFIWALWNIQQYLSRRRQV